MTGSVEPKPPIDPRSPARRLGLAALAVAALGGLAFALARYYPPGVDWEATFFPAIREFFDPYVVPTFTSPPWVLLFLPHALLDLRLGNAINLLIQIVVLGAIIYRHKGGWQALALTFTSPMLLDLARVNNIDWIAALAFLLPPMWGLPLLAVKPQVLGGAALIWWKRQRFSPLTLAPLAAVVALSFAVWGFWPAKIGLIPDAQQWNFAPFPIGIPFGLYLLYRGYKADDEILAACATPLIVPYFAPYSLAPLMALLSSRYRREAIYLWCVFWFYLIVDGRRWGLI